MTLTNATLPGLLSRMGPSLFTPSMIYGGETATFFSTRTFLDAFQPCPERGVLFVPSVDNGSSSASMKVKPLEASHFEAVRGTFETLVLEAQRFIKPFDAGAAKPMTVLATEGDWRIEDYAGDLIGDVSDLKTCEYKLTFAHRSGRFAAIGLHDEGGLSLETGWRRPWAHASQEISLDKNGALTFGAYQVEFLGRAVEGLKALLNLPRLSGAELAVELAARIYASGQYAPDEMGCSLQAMTGSKSKWRDLPRHGNVWTLPPSVDAAEAGLVQVGTRRSVPRRDKSPMRLPIAETYWEKKADGDGHLLARLHNVPGNPMPLHADLKDILWDAALGLLFDGQG